MKVIRTISEFRKIHKTEYNGKTLGFVPTMGALHEGHLSLIDLAKAQNQVSSASIFVNPTQFSATEDFGKYPRVEEKDLSLLESKGVDLVFCPCSSELYPPSFCTTVTIADIQKSLEAQSRPHHFPGVATIVTKLFNIVQPTRAYFGKKDATQTIVIQKLVDDLNIPVEIVLGDTLREANGLAMSSRNQNLTSDYKERAGIIYASLLEGQKELDRIGWEIPTDRILQVVKNHLAKENELEILYVSLESCKTGLTLTHLNEGEEGAILSIACKLGGVRLIDNIRLYVNNNK